MNEILKMLNELKADELDSLIVRAKILLEKKRKEEAEQALLEKERLRQEKIEQEKRRQREIAELQRKLQELQSQKPDIPEPVNGDNFVMREPAAPVQPKPAPAAPQPQPVQPRPAQTFCPHCGQPNAAGSMFCSSCGQRMTAPKAAPQPQPVQPKPAQTLCPHCGQPNVAGSTFCSSCGQRMTAPKAAPQPQASASTAQVRYADESMKKWEMLPGEQSMRGRHEIVMLQPNGGKFAYHMEVTNQRILFYRESSASKNAGMVARMGGGLVGSLIAEGVKAATGAGPKPWLEIPLAAVSSCGLRNKKEFFITADQTYVLKNKNYDIFLPNLVAQAKAKGI